MSWDVTEKVTELQEDLEAACTECLLEKQTSAKFEVGLVSVIHSCIPCYT